MQTKTKEYSFVTIDFLGDKHSLKLTSKTPKTETEFFIVSGKVKDAMKLGNAVVMPTEFTLSGVCDV